MGSNRSKILPNKESPFRGSKNVNESDKDVTYGKPYCSCRFFHFLKRRNRYGYRHFFFHGI